MTLYRKFVVKLRRRSKLPKGYVGAESASGRTYREVEILANAMGTRRTDLSKYAENGKMPEAIGPQSSTTIVMRELAVASIGGGLIASRGIEASSRGTPVPSRLRQAHAVALWLLYDERE